MKVIDLSTNLGKNKISRKKKVLTFRLQNHAPATSNMKLFTIYFVFVVSTMLGAANAGGNDVSRKTNIIDPNSLHCRTIRLDLVSDTLKQDLSHHLLAFSFAAGFVF